VQISWLEDGDDSWVPAVRKKKKKTLAAGLSGVYCWPLRAMARIGRTGRLAGLDSVQSDKSFFLFSIFFCFLISFITCTF
jgi:hypothetical protein